LEYGAQDLKATGNRVHRCGCRDGRLAFGSDEGMSRTDDPPEERDQGRMLCVSGEVTERGFVEHHPVCKVDSAYDGG